MRSRCIVVMTIIVFEVSNTAGVPGSDERGRRYLAKNF